MNKSIYFALPILAMVAACGGGTTSDFDQQNVNFANQNQSGNNNGGSVDDVAVDTIVDLINNSNGTSKVVNVYSTETSTALSGTKFNADDTTTVAISKDASGSVVLTVNVFGETLTLTDTDLVPDATNTYIVYQNGSEFIIEVVGISSFYDVYDGTAATEYSVAFNIEKTPLDGSYEGYETASGVFGSETPASQLPTSYVTASYDGIWRGMVSFTDKVGVPAAFESEATLYINFGSDDVWGNLTEMKFWNSDTGQWEDAAFFPDLKMTKLEFNNGHIAAKLSDAGTCGLGCLDFLDGGADITLYGPNAEEASGMANASYSSSTTIDLFFLNGAMATKK